MHVPADTRHSPAARVLLSVNFNHDGSAVLLCDGRIAAYVNTERFSRVKKHPGLRQDDLTELLAQAGLELGDVDHVLLCNLHNMDSPDIVSLHGSDLKDTWFEFWVNQTNSMVQIGGHRIPCTVNPDHHLIHASAAYFTSPFDSSMALAIDPSGCRGFIGRGTRIYPVLHDFDTWFNANIGYTGVARFLFGSGIIGAGKVMALAPFGEPGDAAGPGLPEPGEVSTFEHLLALADKHPRMVTVAGREINASLAYYIQAGLERQVCAVFAELAGICARNHLDRSICLSGGTSLNVVANQLAFEGSGFERMFLHPACGDDGTAIGAALWYWHHVLGQPRQHHSPADLMYSAREYPDDQVNAALARHAGQLLIDRCDDYLARTAGLLADGKVVGWYEGGSEIGPRALGHRSILADPRDPGMQARINSTIKFREFFRPLAPAVLSERAVEWFGLSDSPFMLRAAPVLRPGLPAITHVDGSARLQTVTRADNPAFYHLIRAFEDRTGVPVVLNTSLNTKGEPIAETPEDALRTLLESQLDYLVMPHTIVSRRAA
jgi:carbamoyltransferase